MTAPRCSHGFIILGCPHDDCPEQGEYLRRQDLAIAHWNAEKEAVARAWVRAALGLPDD